ncbi:MAG: RNA methyltransferase [Muribaculaceae bacterium]|nr:RNA methyltransferase [Muribaculaceae bacterium]
MEVEISSLSQTKRNLLSHLSSKKMRMKYGMFLVEGKKSVKDLIEYCSSQFVILYLVADKSHYDEAVALAKKYSLYCHQNNMSLTDTLNPDEEKINIFVASDEDMKRISTLISVPGIIAVCKLPSTPSEEEILKLPLDSGIYLLLDGVQDPGNLGTIIRTAHWFGIKNIFASKETVDIYNPKVVQASMGSLGSVTINYVNLDQLVVQNPHLPLIGLLLDGNNIFEYPVIESGFIIMGNEGNGISQNLRQKITVPLTIPPYNKHNHSESLNVAVATAITLAHFRK